LDGSLQVLECLSVTAVQPEDVTEQRLGLRGALAVAHIEELLCRGSEDIISAALGLKHAAVTQEQIWTFRVVFGPERE
jgi:hypothetical protein